MALKFKIGDKVKSIVDFGTLPKGSVGVIVNLIPAFNSYYVKFSSLPNEVQIYEDQIALST